MAQDGENLENLQNGETFEDIQKEIDNADEGLQLILEEISKVLEVKSKSTRASQSTDIITLPLIGNSNHHSLISLKK